MENGSGSTHKKVVLFYAKQRIVFTKHVDREKKIS